MASVVEPISNPSSIKTLAETPGLSSIPPKYVYRGTNSDDSTPEDEEDCPQASIPIIDFELLSSGDPHQRLQVIRDLGKACQDWGFFMLVNHEIPERLMKAIIEVVDEFFELPEEEKMEYQTKNVLDPIRYGTSFNASKDQIFFWRDHLKVVVHPQFHSPHTPKSFSDLLLEYSQRSRDLVSKLLGGISESLGLEEDYIHKSLNLDSGQQTFVGNFYPPCPQPELALGLPPHSDHGLLTLVQQNGVGGLQIQHQGRWVNVHALPNSFFVNIGDHLEITSNGKYKSVLHRAVVNNTKKRISLVVANGPSPDTVVEPAPPLIGDDGAKYAPMRYMDYVEAQRSTTSGEKSILERLKLI